MRTIGFILLVGIVCVSRFTFAEDKPASPPSSQPASQPAADGNTPTLVAPGDKDALAANMDKDVVVEGVVDKAEWSSSGKVMKASFKEGGDTKLVVILFVKNREKFDAAFSGDVTKTLGGAKVRV